MFVSVAKDGRVEVLDNGWAASRNAAGEWSVGLKGTVDDMSDFTRASEATALALLKEARSSIPAVTHVDYSARIQTVRRETNPLYYDIIDAFFRSTGCPVIVNTSFNVKDEPIVCSPEDAYRCFMNTHMDVLVMEDFVFLKADQAAASPHQMAVAATK